MKKPLIYLSIFCVIICINSCEKEAPTIEESSALAIDLQNGYWEVDFGVSKSVMKFDESTVNSYWIEGTPPCIIDSNSQNYMLEGNILTLPSAENPLIIKIDGDVLTLLDEVDQMMIEFNRKSTLDYPEC